MPNAQDILWFKTQFQPLIEPAIAGTPFSVDLLAAFACQETGEIWPALRRKGLPVTRVLELCVGDTIDASPTGGGRRAFPKNKAELLAAPDGDRMFAIARQGLVEMADQIPAYRGAASRPDKFCHGFGIFQLDLQFFRTEPAYFLDKRYADFNAALAKCIGELTTALRRLGWQERAALGDLEMAGLAIAYNTGRYDPARGLKQGYFDGTKYYGENFFAYLQLAKSTPLPAPVPAPAPAPALVPRAARAMPGAATNKKLAAKKAPAKKSSAKKAAGKKKAAVTKAPVKRGPARKTPVKKTAPKKIAAKKAATKRPARATAAPRKAAAKKAR